MKTTKMLRIAAYAAALCAVSQPAYAALVPDPVEAEDFDRVALNEATPLSSDEMANLRGGFIDPTGLLYNFSVNVQTAINGAEVFTRSIDISPSGLNGQLQIMANSSLLPQNIPSGMGVNVINNGSGVTVTSAGSPVSTILNQTAAGAPASIILSTGSNLNLAQTVSATLTLQNITAITNFIHSTVSQTAAMAQRNAMRSVGF